MNREDIGKIINLLYEANREIRSEMGRENNYSLDGIRDRQIEYIFKKLSLQK